ncbi:MAG: hypothetical protein LBG48_02470 [Rickettsiales bacterium]|nr:hypothetical protein [Rickettsiales bacterium]
MKNRDITDGIYDYKVFLRDFKSFKFLTFKDTLYDFGRLLLTIIFFPVLVILVLFENKIFAKIIKQIMLFLYFTFVIIFIYSVFTYRSYLRSYRAISVNIPFEDKLRNIE